jgi:hypothetical protein
MHFSRFFGTTFSIAHLNALPHGSLDTSAIDSGNSCTIRKALREYTETALPAPEPMEMIWQ